MQDLTGLVDTNVDASSRFFSAPIPCSLANLRADAAAPARVDKIKNLVRYTADVAC